MSDDLIDYTENPKKDKNLRIIAHLRIVIILYFILRYLLTFYMIQFQPIGFKIIYTYGVLASCIFLVFFAYYNIKRIKHERKLSFHYQNIPKAFIPLFIIYLVFLIFKSIMVFDDVNLSNIPVSLPTVILTALLCIGLITLLITEIKYYKAFNKKIEKDNF